ncbi:MAG TPA: hypothetical protein DCP97_01855 [Ruminococcaceae bacterium]|nr:hypothetical protein [Oscillospiraceae bacterium]
MQTMYPAIVNSPETVTKGALTNSTTSIEVADASIFTAVGLPLPLTLGQGSSAETVLLTAVSGNILTVQRGFQGIARTWEAGTAISRNFTAYDHDAFKNNIYELVQNKADKITGFTAYLPKFKEDGNLESSGIPATAVQTKTGDIKDNITTFTPVETRENLTTGEKISVSLGKTAKWFTDLGAHLADTVAHMTAAEKIRLNVASNPNLLINSDFRIRQFDNITSLPNHISQYGKQYLIDCWLTYQDAINGLYVNWSGNGIAIKKVAGAYAGIANILEPYSYIVGQTITISALVDGAVKSYTILNFANEQGYSVGSANGTYLYVRQDNTKLEAGVMANDNAEHTISWIKLEIGAVNTPYTPRPYPEELRLCQRYYEHSDYNYELLLTTDGRFSMISKYAVEKRTSATVTIRSMNNTIGKISYYNGAGWTDVNYADIEQRSKGYRIGCPQTLGVDHPIFAWNWIADARL